MPGHIVRVGDGDDATGVDCGAGGVVTVHPETKKVARRVAHLRS